MLSFRDFLGSLRKLEINRSQPVFVHSSLSAFGEVHGGAETVLGALMGSFNTTIMPAFTYKTMLIPEAGPANNGITYGSGKDTNRMAEFFDPAMPADRLIGVIPETLRQRSQARRSSHPILSFTGVNADGILEAQTIEEPFAPIRKLHEAQGWVLLLGVDHSVNTSIHYAERTAGRKQFIRWALTSKGVVECPGFPGCSSGFTAIAPYLQNVSRKVQLGPAIIEAVPLPGLVEVVQKLVSQDPLALLCDQEDCERCQAVRAAAQPTR